MIHQHEKAIEILETIRHYYNLKGIIEHDLAEYQFNKPYIDLCKHRLDIYNRVIQRLKVRYNLLISKIKTI